MTNREVNPFSCGEKWESCYRHVGGYHVENEKHSGHLEKCTSCKQDKGNNQRLKERVCVCMGAGGGGGAISSNRERGGGGGGSEDGGVRVFVFEAFIIQTLP